MGLEACRGGSRSRTGERLAKTTGDLLRPGQIGPGPSDHLPTSATQRIFAHLLPINRVVGRLPRLEQPPILGLAVEFAQRVELLPREVRTSNESAALVVDLMLGLWRRDA
jgi:hypothetical protein